MGHNCGKNVNQNSDSGSLTILLLTAASYPVSLELDTFRMLQQSISASFISCTTLIVLLLTFKCVADGLLKIQWPAIFPNAAIL